MVFSVFDVCFFMDIKWRNKLVWKLILFMFYKKVIIVVIGMLY